MDKQTKEIDIKKEFDKFMVDLINKHRPFEGSKFIDDVMVANIYIPADSKHKYRLPADINNYVLLTEENIIYNEDNYSFPIIIALSSEVTGLKFEVTMNKKNDFDMYTLYPEKEENDNNTKKPANKNYQIIIAIILFLVVCLAKAFMSFKVFLIVLYMISLVLYYIFIN